MDDDTQTIKSQIQSSGNTIADICQKCLKKVKEDNLPKKICWETGEYSFIKKLSCDERGKWGELFSMEVLRANGHDITDDNIDKTEEEFDFEVKDKKKKVENKLATIGVSLTFQYEFCGADYNLRSFDLLIILAILPSKIFMKCWKKEEIPWDTMHIRDSGNYKLTLGLNAFSPEEEIKSPIDFERLIQTKW